MNKLRLLAPILVVAGTSVYSQVSVLSRVSLLQMTRDNYSIRTGSASVIPAVRREMRAAWVATVSNIDWPSASSLSTSAQQAEIVALLDLMVTLKMNAVFVQVRSQADALYSSSIEPWARCLRGTMGTAPSPLYDPLSYWLTQAHNRGIEVYAWFNPYRALSSSTTSTPALHIRNANPTACDLYPTSATANSVWIDPSGTGAVQTTNVIMDVVNRYDVDGVVFDDYFYPYPYNSVDYPDSDAYSAYTSGGGTLSKANWRRSIVDTFVFNIGQQIKLAKPWVKYGIGPFGIWKPGNPAGITGLSAYDELYADSKKWLNLGWVDFLSPQLYWTIASSGQPYDDLLTWWTQQNLTGKFVWPSNYTSQLNGTWPVSEIVNQIDVTRATPGATGNVHYSIKALKNNWATIKDTLIAGQYAENSVPPAFTWIDNSAPSAPAISSTYNSGVGSVTMSWTPQGPETPTYYVLKYMIGATWTTKVYTPTTTSLTIPIKNSGQTLRAFGVSSVDRAFNMSPFSQIVIDPTLINTNVKD